MKTHTKKKAYHLHCKQQYRKLLVPDANGNWVQARGTTGQHCISGALGKRVAM